MSQTATRSADAHEHLGDHHGDVVVDHSHHAHVCSAGLFAGVFVALLFLTFVTVAVAQFDFGAANLLIAMAIAAMKAALVASVFMHLRWDTAINNIAFLGSLIFLSLLFLFTLADHATRGDADPVGGSHAPYAIEPEFSGGGSVHTGPAEGH